MTTQPQGKIDPHDLLVAHLKSILQEAEAKEFHDFQNKKYPAPKMELASQLNRIRENVINGLYDNQIT